MASREAIDRFNLALRATSKPAPEKDPNAAPTVGEEIQGVGASLLGVPSTATSSMITGLLPSYARSRSGQDSLALLAGGTAAAKDMAPDSVKRADATPIIGEDDQGNLQFNAPSVGQVARLVTDSSAYLPSILAGARAAGFNPAASSGRNAVSLGAANAAVVGGEQRQQTLTEARAEAQRRGLTGAEAEQFAGARADTALRLTAPISFTTGAAGLGLASKLGSASKSRLGGFAKGLAADTPFEGIEEFGQSLAADQAMQRELDFVQASNAGVLGALAGGVTGGVVGLAQTPTPATAPPAAPDAIDEMPPPAPPAPPVSGQPGADPGAGPDQGPTPVPPIPTGPAPVEVAPGVVVDPSAGALSRAVAVGAQDGSLEEVAFAEDQRQADEEAAAADPAQADQQQAPEPARSLDLTQNQDIGSPQAGFDLRQPAPAPTPKPAPTTDEQIIAAVSNYGAGQFTSDTAKIVASALGVDVARVRQARSKVRADQIQANAAQRKAAAEAAAAEEAEKQAKKQGEKDVDRDGARPADTGTTASSDAESSRQVVPVRVEDRRAGPTSDQSEGDGVSPTTTRPTAGSDIRVQDSRAAVDQAGRDVALARRTADALETQQAERSAAQPAAPAAEQPAAGAAIAQEQASENVEDQRPQTTPEEIRQETQVSPTVREEGSAGVNAADAQPAPDGRAGRDASTGTDEAPVTQDALNRALETKPSKEAKKALNRAKLELTRGKPGEARKFVEQAVNMLLAGSTNRKALEAALNQGKDNTNTKPAVTATDAGTDQGSVPPAPTARTGSGNAASAESLLRSKADGQPAGLAKTFTILADAVGKRDVEAIQRVVGVLDNKRSRDAFTEATGVKLPRTVSGTRDAVKQWAESTRESDNGTETSRADRNDQRDSVSPAPAGAPAAEAKSSATDAGSERSRGSDDSVPPAKAYAGPDSAGVGRNADEVSKDVGPILAAAKAAFDDYINNKSANDYKSLPSKDAKKKYEIGFIDGYLNVKLTNESSSDSSYVSGNFNGTKIRENTSDTTEQIQPTPDDRAVAEARPEPAAQPEPAASAGTDQRGAGSADGGVRRTRKPAAGKADGSPDVGDAKRDERVSPAADRSVGATDQRVPSDGIDFVAGPGALNRTGSWTQTAARNLDLIDLARKIDAEKRQATPEEQAQLAQYVGFGAGPIRNEMFPVPPPYMKAKRPDALIYPEAIAKPAWKALAERAEKLPTEWQRSILRSSQYAHYTSESIVRSTWKAVQRLGFNGGKTLEPGVGIGNFHMLMPDALRAPNAYTGIEFDAPTALIARLLSPQQNMLHSDFINRKMPPDFFDVAIGNPPFSKTPVLADPKYVALKLRMHDFFFAKAMDSVRPGGLLAFVTSKGTMDKISTKARGYLADRADLMGAIRLPSVAFEDNAGTSVVTDVIFLRKRAPGEAAAGHAWRNVGVITTPEGDTRINEYFIANPQMVLGQHRLAGGVDEETGKRINANGYGGEKQYTVLSNDTPAELDAKFAAAIELLPENVYSAQAHNTPSEIRKVARKVEFDPDVKREGVIYVNKTGELMRVTNGIGVSLASEMNMQKKDAGWLKGYVKLRDLVNASRLAQSTDGDWKAAQKALNDAYDAFRAEHGPVLAYRTQQRKGTDDEGNPTIIESRVMLNRRLYREDYDSALVTQLETITETGDIVKTRFLKERTIARPREREIRTVNDSLAVSLDELGTLNLADVGKRLGLSQPEVIEALGTQVYRDTSGSWQLSDEYLSGNVVDKLEQAQLAVKSDPSLQRNVDALLEVQPVKLAPEQISVKLGATWVPVEHIQDFAREIGAGNVTFDRKTESYQVEGAGKHSGRVAGAEFSTSDRSPSDLLESLLNSRTTKVTVSREKKVDQEATAKATAAALEAVKKIKAKFRTWIWEDGTRAQDLVDLYNRQFNNLAPRRFDGSHMTLPGVASWFKPHPHQLRAILRQVQTGNTYLAHAVGAGKTFEMIAGGMEQRRLGLIQKPVYVVPNHMLEQFSNEFLEFYPAANIMVADDQNFSAERRKAFVAAATMNAPDALVITHSAFERIGVKEESVAPIRDALIAELEEELEDSGKGDRVKRSQLEQQIEAVTQRFERIVGAGSKDSTIKFEDIGIDFIYADEAHVFRKLDFTTNQKVKGIDPNGSRRAMDMYVKTRILESQRPGRSMAFASGTAVTNTMGELYTIMRFFAPQQMEEAGISSFDAWARMFGEVAPALERNAAGSYETVERFAKFENVPELMSMIRQFMDVLTSEQLGGIVVRPDIEGGKPNLIAVEPTTDLTNYMRNVLGPRLERSKRWKPSKEEPNNPDPVVAIITDGRFAALDPRFVGGKVAPGQTTKLNRMAEGIAQEYHATAGNTYLDKDKKPMPTPGGTQVVFYNLGFGQQSMTSRGFDARSALMRMLTAAGVKREHVGWFDDADTDAKKEKVFKQMRSGELRVLIGSAKKMGTGVNVQNRLTALHYLDPPWFPSDVEQPHGRILRQGNQNKTVRINWYATKSTYDSTMWQMVARKQRFIDQAFSGDKSLRTMEDMSEASAYEQAAAIASGDPRAVQLAGLRQDAERLVLLQQSHSSEAFKARRALAEAESNVKHYEKALPRWDAAVSAIGGYVSMRGAKIGRLSFDKMGEFGLELQEAAQKVINARGLDPNSEPAKLGELAGQPLMIEQTFMGENKPTGGFELYFQVADVKVPFGQMNLGEKLQPQGAVGLAQRAINSLNGIEQRRDAQRADLDEAKADVRRLEKKVSAPFAYAQEMLDNQRELTQLEAELAAEGQSAAKAASAAVDAEAKAQGSEPRTEFSKTEPTIRESRTVGMQRKALADHIDRIMSGWKQDRVPPVTVVQSAADLPAAVRNAPGFDETVNAAHTPDGIWLVADRIANATRGEVVLAHEVIGHYAVEQIVGDAWPQLVAQIKALRKSGSMADLFAELDRRYGAMDDLTMAREAIAVMSERGIRNSILARVMAAIRKFFRDIGMKVDFTEADLRGLIAQAGRWIEGGRGPVTAGEQVPAFSKQDEEQTGYEVEEVEFDAVEWAGLMERARNASSVEAARKEWSQKGVESSYFKRWFGDSKVKRGGKPAKLYHGTNGSFTTFTQADGSASGMPGSGLGIFSTFNKQIAETYGGRVLEMYGKVEKPYKMGIDEFNGFEFVEQSARRREELQAQGYDGVWIPDMDTVVAFDSAQLKSVSNRGTFSQASGDIMFSKGNSQTETEAFKRWFGDSKVVDADGKPLVVYHGTNGNFDVFRTQSNSVNSTTFGDIDTKRTGVFLSDNQDFARQYGNKVMMVYAAIENPAEITRDLILDFAESIDAFGPDRNLRIQAKNTRSWGFLEGELGQRFAAFVQGRGHDGVKFSEDLETDEGNIESNTFVAFRPGQIKSADQNTGSFDPNNPSIVFSRLPPDQQLEAIESPLRRMKQLSESIKQGLTKQGLSDKVSTWKPSLLGALTLRQLGEVATRLTTKVTDYARTVQEMQTRRNLLLDRANTIATEWEKYQRAHRKDGKSDALANLMHDSTIAGVDGAEPYLAGTVTLLSGEVVPMTDAAVASAIAKLKEQAKGKPEKIKGMLKQEVQRLEDGLTQEAVRRAEYPKLRARYNALGPDGQAVYKKVRNEYVERSNDWLKALLNRIAGTDMPAGERAKLTDKIRAHFESARIQAPYFPLARFGEWWVAAENADGVKQFRMAESPSELRQHIAELKAAGFDQNMKRGKKLDTARAVDGASSSFMAEVTGILDSNGVRESVRDEVYQLYLRTLPDLSVRKQFIHRKKTAGYATDALRAFASHTTHGSHQLARLEYGRDLEDGMSDLKKAVEGMQTKMDTDDAERGAMLYNEMVRRHEWVMNPKDSSAVQTLSSLNFVWYLGFSPAAAIINLSQSAMMTLPTVAAKYGWGKASAAMSKAMAQAVRSMGNIEKHLTTADERAAYDELKARGDIDRTQAHDLAGIGDSDTRGYNPIRTKVMKFFSWGFHKTEIMNREASGIAAYRLAREAGDSHVDAVVYASDIINQTHYDYSNANRARFMQGSAQKILFAFKQYSQNTTYFLWRAFHQTFKGADPATRREARRRLVGTLGMTSVFAGVLGLPLMTLTFSIINGLQAIFGDDDEPFSAEVEFRNFLNDYLGEGMGRVAQYGAIQTGIEAAGLPTPSLADRLKLDQLWARPPDRELEGRELANYWLEQIAGPIGGMVLINPIRGGSLIAEGELMRGVETMVPKGVRDLMKATRYQMEGVENLRGDPLINDVGIGESMLQASGFSPARVSEVYQKNSAAKGYEGQILQRRAALMDGYVSAMEMQDSEAIREAVAAIMRFNTKWPAKKINGNALRRSMQSRQAYSARAVNGIVIDRKLAPAIEERVRF